jgi:hypothetical protein
MKSLDILSVGYLENLAESLNFRAHSKERAMALVVTCKRTERFTQRKIHRGRTGLREADREWRGEMIYSTMTSSGKVSARKQEINELLEGLRERVGMSKVGY